MLPPDHEALRPEGLKQVPDFLEGLPRGGQEQPRPGSKIPGTGRPIPLEVPKSKLTVLVGPHPVLDEDVGGLVSPLRPTTDDPLKRSERQKIRSSLPHEGKVEPLGDLSPSKRRGEDLLKLPSTPLTDGVVKPKLPPPTPLPITKVTPQNPQNPPQVSGGKHVQRPPHSPGPHNLPTTHGVINIPPSQPVGPNPHSKPTGPNILPLKRDDSGDSINNRSRPPPPDPISGSPNRPKIHNPRLGQPNPTQRWPAPTPQDQRTPQPWPETPDLPPLPLWPTNGPQAVQLPSTTGQTTTAR